VPHSDVNQAQRVMCEPAAHNPRHQGMPVFADAFDQCSRTPAAPIAIPARFLGRFREGDGQRDRRLSSFSFGVLNALNEKRSNCAGKCAPSVVPNPKGARTVQTTRMVALSAKATV